jgi:hypothetical protein
MRLLKFKLQLLWKRSELFRVWVYSLTANLVLWLIVLMLIWFAFPELHGA